MQRERMVEFAREHCAQHGEVEEGVEARHRDITSTTQRYVKGLVSRCREDAQADVHLGGSFGRFAGASAELVDLRYYQRPERLDLLGRRHHRPVTEHRRVLPGGAERVALS